MATLQNLPDATTVLPAPGRGGDVAGGGAQLPLRRLQAPPARPRSLPRSSSWAPPLAAFLRPRTWLASSKVLVKLGETVQLAPAEAPSRSMYLPLNQDVVKTEADIVKSQVVISEAVKRLGIEPEPGTDMDQLLAAMQLADHRDAESRRQHPADQLPRPRPEAGRAQRQHDHRRLPRAPQQGLRERRACPTSTAISSQMLEGQMNMRGAPPEAVPGPERHRRRRDGDQAAHGRRDRAGQGPAGPPRQDLGAAREAPDDPGTARQDARADRVGPRSTRPTRPP